MYDFINIFEFPACRTRFLRATRIIAQFLDENVINLSKTHFSGWVKTQNLSPKPLKVSLIIGLKKGFVLKLIFSPKNEQDSD